MLLWCAVMACFAAVLSRQARNELVLTALCVQAALLAGALAFVLFASNPFTRQIPPPLDGQALTPLLQDVALAAHPPMLYLGYVGFSVVFSLACAGLWHKRLDSDWARMARPWICVPWAALTLGIGLGSWWAYRVLGWGGFWFWDPVENASLLPWLAGTALLHVSRVLEKRGMLAAATALLAILTFAMSLIGTFLVRSGLVTSVHSFASDPARGAYILGYFAVSVGGALTLFAWRAPGGPRPQPLSREGVMLMGAVLLGIACATVLLGTLYPMLAEWLGEGGIAVGALYFQMTVLPVLGLCVVLAGLAQRLRWERDNFSRLAPALVNPALATLAGGLIVLTLATREVALAAVCIALAVWMVAALLFRPRARLSVMLAHGGAALVILGMVGAGLWQSAAHGAPGQALKLGPYTAIYEGMEPVLGPTYHGQGARLRIEDAHGMVLGSLTPQLRMYDGGEHVATPAILPRLWGDIYAVATPEGVELRLEPLIYALWLGCALAASGGLLALRRR